MIRLPKQFLKQTARKEPNGTWTAFRYVLCASTGSKSKREAVRRMREVSKLMNVCV